MDLIKGSEYLVSKGLNPSQVDAVMDFSHDLLVLSTAGSGKTRVISEKIAFALNYMLYEPSSILALTYTKKAAEEMRNRVATLCGNRVRLDELKISTFNAYGMSLISKYMSDYEYDVVDEIDQQIIIKGIKEEMIARGNTSCKDAKTKDLVDLIAKTKCSGIRPENQAAVHKTAKNAKIPDFPEIYKAYEETLHDNNMVDFEDQILKSIEILDNRSDVRDELHERYRLILVDEYQDTNRMQDVFLNKLRGHNTQLVIVGDDDQSIYGFRGAEVENIRKYDNLKGFRTVHLAQNYRSSKAILEFADAIIRQDAGRKQKRIFTEKPYGEKPYCLEAKDMADEINQVIRVIKRKEDTETAILARINVTLNRFIYPMLKAGLDIDIKDSIYQLLKPGYMQRVYAFLLLLERPDNTEAFRALADSKVTDEELDEVIPLSKDFITSLKIGLEKNIFNETSAPWVGNFLRCYDEAKHLKDKSVSDSFEDDVIKAVLGGDALSGNKKASQRERIREFLQLKNTGLVKSGSTLLRDFLLTLKSDSGESRIKLLTIHASKGLEFERVFIVHVNEGFIPLERVENDEENDEGSIEKKAKERAEELRLFFVAATRAEKQLYLSYVNSDDKIDDIQPSSFLDAIDSSLYEYTLADEYVFKEDDKPAPMVADVSSEISFSVGDIVETSRGENAVVTEVGDKIFIKVSETYKRYSYELKEALKELKLKRRA